MQKSLTVKELKDLLVQIEQKGYGDYVVSVNEEYEVYGEYEVVEKRKEINILGMD